MKALFVAGAIGLMTIAVPAQTLVATEQVGPAGLLYEINWPGSTKTLWGPSTRPLANVRSVAYAEGSYGVRDATGAGTELLLVTSTGATTLARFNWGNCLDLESGQDRALYGGFRSGLFARIWPTTAALTTVPGGISAITRDFDTGDFLVAGNTSGALIRIDPVTRTQTTITSALLGVIGLEFVPWLGQLLVTRAGIGVNLVDPDGSIVTTLRNPPLNATFATACCVDHVGHRMFVAFNGSVAGGSIAEYASDGTLVSQRFVGNEFLSGIDMHMADEVGVETATGQRGSACTLRVRFPSSPNRAYCCAISLGYRQGLSFSANNNLNLDLDLFFLLTVCGGLPGFTANFTGTLDADGKPPSPPQFMIPPLLSPSDVIYVGGVAVNPSFSDNLDVSETAVIKVR